jgi:hypothetical protein
MLKGKLKSKNVTFSPEELDRSLVSIECLYTEEELEKLRECMTENDDYEKDKYFVPTIEDIRVGYECEVFSSKALEITNTLNSGEFWIKKVIKNNGIASWAEELVNSKRIRVPFLTEEQIENEGWIKLTENSFRKPSSTIQNWYYTLWFHEDISKRIVETYYIDNLNNILNLHIIYRGSIKSINELRYISKLLKI